MTTGALGVGVAEMDDWQACLALGVQEWCAVLTTKFGFRAPLNEAQAEIFEGDIDLVSVLQAIPQGATPEFSGTVIQVASVPAPMWVFGYGVTLRGTVNQGAECCVVVDAPDPGPVNVPELTDPIGFPLPLAVAGVAHPIGNGTFEVGSGFTRFAEWFAQNYTLVVTKGRCTVEELPLYTFAQTGTPICEGWGTAMMPMTHWYNLLNNQLRDIGAKVRALPFNGEIVSEEFKQICPSIVESAVGALDNSTSNRRIVPCEPNLILPGQPLLIKLVASRASRFRDLMVDEVEFLGEETPGDEFSNKVVNGATPPVQVGFSSSTSFRLFDFIFGLELMGVFPTSNCCTEGLAWLAAKSGGNMNLRNMYPNSLPAGVQAPEGTS